MEKSHPSQPEAVKAAYEDRLRFWQRVGAGLMVVCAIMAFISAYSIPGSLMFSALEAENEELSENLGKLRRALPKLDKINQRLQMYETQLQGIGTFAPKTSSNVGIIQENLQHEPLFGHGDGDENDTGEGPEDRTRTWVESVLDRIKALEKSFERVEPNLNIMVAELEDLDALRRAMPSRWPILGTHGSSFGWRKSPINGRRVFHRGIDISAATGTPIFATADGIVDRAGWMQGYGWAVDIQHGFGLLTRYAHCSRLKVKKGDVVEKGDLLGWVGQTGRATGPHVHFEIRLDNEPLDPTEFIGY